MDTNLVVTDDATYEELRAAQDQIAAQLAGLVDEARAKALESIVANVLEFGFTAEELNKALGGKAKASKASKPKAPRKPAAPKYRNPADGSTWTGRGMAPAWIKHLAKEDRDQFLIEGSDEQKEVATPAPVPSTPEASETPEGEAQPTTRLFEAEEA